MKTKYSLLLFILTTALMAQSFNDPYLNLKKRITDKQYKYEFYTTTKKLNPRTDILYYWFKGGAIHTSQEGIAGELLEGQFDKFFLNNQLAERGKFKKGKKIGMWRTWHSNGMLATEVKWAGGQKNGNFYAYNEEGKLIEQGLYRVDKKQGKWINFSRKDTINYRNNNIIVKKVKKTKQEKDAEKNLKKTIKEKKEDNKELQPKNKKVDKEFEKSKKANSENLNKPSKKEVKSDNKTVKKENFFNRLFSKKDKTKTSDVKGS